ncbi:MAG TPA: DUF262 domain-containing protein [Candidatus Solibacter sp.]|nr:DUF262 domain-containing protein [Candidatus Solibacter sp.]
MRQIAKQARLFMDAAEIARAEQQIAEKQRTINYDTKEFTVELLVNKFRAGEFTIPRYQREFVWSDERRSRFIESVILGLPIPFMFTAETPEGVLEIVDGAQRIRTLSAFMDDGFRLRSLGSLNSLNGVSYSDLPAAQQRKFKNRTLRMIVLSDNTTTDSKFDIFERINTGSDSLRNAELRKGAYPGPFYQLVDECAGKTDFMRLCPINERVARRGERQELVLRFFAYAERYQTFKHDVARFLNAYVVEKNNFYKTSTPEAAKDRLSKVSSFAEMLLFVDKFFPFGFAKTQHASTTPRVRFEAIAVGTHLALQINPSLRPRDMSWINSSDFQHQVTTHASNSAPRLTGRIEYVRDMLLSAV